MIPMFNPSNGHAIERVANFASLAPFETIALYSGIVTAYKNKQYIADLVCPRKQVNTSSFLYRKYAEGQFFTLPSGGTLVNRTGTPRLVEFGSTNSTGSVNGYGLRDIIPQKDIDDAIAAGGHDPVAVATMGLSQLTQLDHEIRVAALIFGSTNYNSNNRTTLTGTDQWSEAVSNPLRAFEAAKATMLTTPNILVLGYDVYAALRINPVIVTAVRKMYTGDGRVKAEDLAALWDLDRVIIGEARYNTAADGQTTSLGRIWGKHAALLTITAGMSPMDIDPTFAFTAQFGPKVARTSFVDTGLQGGTQLVVGEYVSEVAASDKAGFLWTNAVA